MIGVLLQTLFGALWVAWCLISRSRAGWLALLPISLMVVRRITGLSEQTQATALDNVHLPTVISLLWVVTMLAMCLEAWGRWKKQLRP